MPFCTQCGHENPEGARFCARCGEPLPASTPRAGDGQPAPVGTPTEPAEDRQTTDTTTVIPAFDDSQVNDALSDDDQAAIRDLPAGSALLIVRRGPNEGSRYLLEGEQVTVGRQEDSDIFLDDITVSRHHAVFSHGEDGWTITDNGSLNGTYVRKTLTDGPVLLRHGDELQFGRFRFIFYASSRDLG